MTAGSSQHRKPIWDVITRRGSAKKTLVSKTVRNRPPKFPQGHPLNPKSTKRFYMAMTFQSQQFMRTNWWQRGDMRRWRFVEPPKPSISSMELAMRREFGHGHCWGETQLEEVLHQFISCPTTDSNVFLKACFYINVVQDFFHQQVWGCIFNVWCVTLFNFVFLFLGVGGHDCRFPRKPLDEAHMHQHSNRAWNLFLCLPGIFVFRAHGLCFKM